MTEILALDPFGNRIELLELKETPVRKARVD